jgi:4-hydroxybenzoate polyprenyltransferase
MKKFNDFFNNLLEKEISLLTFAFSFLSLLMLRVFIEHFAARSPFVNTYEIAIEYVHDFYFFLITFLLLWMLLSFFLNVNPKKLTYFFLWGSLLVIFPPLIDMIRTGGAVFWSFYVLSSLSDLPKIFLTIFGNLPSGIVYFGTKILFIVAIIFVAMLIYFKTRNYFKTILGTLGAYAVLFFMGAFPTFFFFAYSFFSGTRKIAEIRPFNIVQFFGAADKIFGITPQVSKYVFVYNLNFIFFPFLLFLILAIFFIIDRQKLFAVVKNIRLPQIIYHSGLFLVGMGLGYLNYPENFNLNVLSFFAVLSAMATVWLSWIASVVFNDIYDFGIDNISNPDRPLPKKIFTVEEYAHLGMVCFFLALVGAVSLGFSFLALVAVYQLLAWLYSCSPFRLKKFPFVATFISSLASLMILFFGYILMSADQTIYSLSFRIVLLLMITYTLSLPIKDFKDIEGDKKFSIWTVPVIFSEKKARLIVAVNLFISYMLSVFFLNELRLFWPAMIFGGVSFLVVNNEKINPRKLPFWILGIVSLYALILVKVVFI